MELIDTLTSEGNLTGLAKSRKAVHELGEWHRVIFVFVLNSKNEVLLQHRSAIKDHYPNLWDVSIGGHVSTNEDSLRVAVREVEEEIGLHITETDLEHLGALKTSLIKNDGTYFDNEFSDVYLLRTDKPIKDFVMQTTEVQDLKWIEIKKLQQMVDEKDQTLTPRYEQYELLLNTLKK